MKRTDLFPYNQAIEYKVYIIYPHKYMILLFTSFVKFPYKKSLKRGVEMRDNRLFIAEVKKQLAIRGWKYDRLAKEIGYPLGSLYGFMCNKRSSDRMKNAIASVLEISI